MVRGWGGRSTRGLETGREKRPFCRASRLTRVSYTARLKLLTISGALFGDVMQIGNY